MTLSCDCSESWEAERFFRDPDDYTTYTGKRGKRCASCGNMIRAGDTCAEFLRFRYPESEVELKIHGDWGAVLPMAPVWHCERCADLFFSLQELGYCMDCHDSMMEALKEHHEMSGTA